MLRSDARQRAKWRSAPAKLFRQAGLTQVDGSSGRAVERCYSRQEVLLTCPRLFGELCTASAPERRVAPMQFPPRQLTTGQHLRACRRHGHTRDQHSRRHQRGLAPLSWGCSGGHATSVPEPQRQSRPRSFADRCAQATRRRSRCVSRRGGCREHSCHLAARVHCQSDGGAGRQRGQGRG